MENGKPKKKRLKVPSEILRSNRLQTPTDILVNRMRRETIQKMIELGIKQKFDIFKLLGYPAQTLAFYLMKFLNKPCVRCNKTIINLENSQMDHIYPISTAKNLAQIVELSRLKNMRLICRKCNREKSDKIEE